MWALPAAVLFSEGKKAGAFPLEPVTPLRASPGYTTLLPPCLTTQPPLADP